MPIAALIPKQTAAPSGGDTTPSQTAEVSWTTEPLEVPNWEAITSYLRSFSTTRGRNYEFERVEAGKLQAVFDNRDRDFDPTNTTGAFYPNVKPTRRIRTYATWDGITYPIIQAFTEGFPQDFPGDGFDAVVQQRATDWFYPLNMLKFSGATTTLTVAVTTAPAAGTVQTITVGSTALPLPQAFPFVIQVGTGLEIEKMNVLSSPAPNNWTVERGHDSTTVRTFVAGTQVRSEAVRFAEEQSGGRINNCLDFLGVASVDRDIDDGNTLIAASDDLAGQSILEHMLLVAECENGRLFAARDGTITFRERHTLFTEELSSAATFGSGAGEVPYLSRGVQLAHDDAKLFNHIRITLPNGVIVESFDQDSIDDHFQRTLDKTWPMASENEAQDAADWMLHRLKQAQLRVPRIAVVPTVANGDTAWPAVLSAEIGSRYHIVVEPSVAGEDVIDTDVIVEGIAHTRVPGSWEVAFELSQADETAYWRLEVAGASELDETTVLAY